MSGNKIRFTGTLEQLAHALGGDVRAGQVQAPGPEHSMQGRSMSVKLDDTALDGFVVHSLAGDDPMQCKNYVREKLELPPWKPQQKGAIRSGKSYVPTIARHIYRRADLTPYLCVHRLADKSGFPQYQWDGEK